MTLKRLVPLLILILIVVVTVPLLRDRESREPQQLEDLPWQVETLPDGASRVFGLTLGRDTFKEARDKLGHDMDLAIIARSGEQGALEMYYSRFTAGILSGKLILGTNMPGDTLAELRERAVKSEYLDSGARKFILDPADLPTAYSSSVDTVTFIPAVQLDENIIVRRFGEPARRLQLSDQVTHYLYPDIGLDLILNAKGKEVLQYVPPKAFDQRIRKPLEEALAAQNADA